MLLLHRPRSSIIGPHACGFLLLLRLLIFVVVLHQGSIRCFVGGVVLEPWKLDALYREARQVRILHGHDAAQPLYAYILQTVNPSDMTTATRLAAAVGEPLSRLRMACRWDTNSDKQLEDISTHSTMMQKIQIERLRTFLLRQCHFTTETVHQCLVATTTNSSSDVFSRQSAAPIYVTGAAPGTVHQFPFSSTTMSPSQCCVALFLLGVAVPESILQTCFHTNDIQLLLDLGLVCRCEYNPELLYSLVSIVPVDIHHAGKPTSTLYIVTDLHPKVLNLIKISKEEEAVMYIGPDSLALVQHWLLKPTHDNKKPHANEMIDLCTGSGIQALVVLASGTMNRAVCVDTNPRALRFTAFSAALNGLEDKIILVQGDLLRGRGCLYPIGNERGLYELLRGLSSNSNGFDLATVNPPFLPVPEFPGDSAGNRGNRMKSKFGQREEGTTESDFQGCIVSVITKRYGLFSAGGSSGEEVLAAALNLSNSLLKGRGFLVVVSEFFFRADSNGEVDNEGQRLLTRLQHYWNKGVYTTAKPISGSKGLLFTNQYPISSAVYAERRADSLEEASMWRQHLQEQKIFSCSPGLLYIQKSIDNDFKKWMHVLVPKTTQGSIWTPTNTDAISFTRSVSKNYFESS